MTFHFLFKYAIGKNKWFDVFQGLHFCNPTSIARILFYSYVSVSILGHWTFVMILQTRKESFACFDTLRRGRFNSAFDGAHRKTSYDKYCIVRKHKNLIFLLQLFYWKFIVSWRHFFCLPVREKYRWKIKLSRKIKSFFIQNWFGSSLQLNRLRTPLLAFFLFN